MTDVENIQTSKQKERRLRKKKPREMGTAPTKVPKFVERFQKVAKELSKFRGNGEWTAHKQAIEKLHDEYKRDEDNQDIILLIQFEEAAGFCERNDVEKAEILSNKIGKNLKRKIDGGEHITDLQGIVYCKCLFLAAKLHCMKRGFGKAQKCLETAKNFLSDCDNIEMKCESHLTNAYYQLCLNQGLHCTSERANLVIDSTNKAEQILTAIKDPEIRDGTKRNLLLLRCKAVMQLYLEGEDKETFATLLNDSLKELECQLWNDISLRQKVCNVTCLILLHG